MAFSQKLEFRASHMTKIAAFALLELPNLILRKFRVSQNVKLRIFATSKCAIFPKNKNSGPPKLPKLQFYVSLKIAKFDFT